MGTINEASTRIESLLTESDDQPKEEETIQNEAEEPEILEEEGIEADEEEDGQAPEASEVTEETDEVESEQAEVETEQETQELPSNLQALAEQSGMEADDLLNLKLTVKVNGEEKEVTLGDLRSGHMMEADYRNKTAELSEQRKTFEGERENLQAQWNQRIQEVNVLSQSLEQQLLSDYNNVDWNALRAEDPAEFSARQVEFTNRANQLEGIKQKAQSELKTAQAEYQDKVTQEQSSYIAKQQELLAAKLPDWGVPEKQKQIKSDIAGYLTGEGFSNDDMSSLVDHRHLLMVRKAMMYDKMLKAKPEVKKIVKKAPKMTKPGAKQSKADINSQSRAKQRNRLKHSGEVRDAASLLENLM